MKRLICYMLLCCPAFGFAQETNENSHTRIEHNIIAGFNFGAATPVPLPATIREIKSYSPAFSPTIGYEAVYHCSEKWGISAGIKLDFKGMTVKDRVMYMRTSITVQGGSSTGSFSGYFSGMNETNINNGYLTVPLNATYDFNSKWRGKAGIYAAWLFSRSFKGNVSDGYMRNGSYTGEKIIIDKATFDLSEDQNSIDFGLNIGAERLVGKRLAVMTNFSWGLNPLFKKQNSTMDFNMYHIFLAVGVNYRIHQ